MGNKLRALFFIFDLYFLTVADSWNMWKVLSGITAHFKDNTELDRVWLLGDNNAIRVYTTYPIQPNGTECSGLVLPVHIALFFTMKRIN